MHTRRPERSTPNVPAVVAGVAIAAALLWLNLKLPRASPGTAGAPAPDVLQLARSGWVPFAAGFIVFVGAPLWGRARMTDASVLALLVTMMCLAVPGQTAAPAAGYARLVLAGSGVLSPPWFIAGAALGAVLRPARRPRHRPGRLPARTP
jgi:hypothetical protein